MWQWPTFSSVVIGLILLPATVCADAWHYSGATLAKSELPLQAAGESSSAEHRSPAPDGRLPRNNMTQVAVRNEFGDPQEQLPAVGEPPISRWRYLDYTVYFERDRVIIAVPNDVGVTR